MAVKVLIIEESTYQRNLFSEMLSTEDKIEIIDMSKNPEEAVESLKKNLPDVLVLDIGKLEIEKIEVFKNLLKTVSVPTIILTTTKVEDIPISFQPFISKGFDLIIKPGGIWKEQLPKIKDELIHKVKLASTWKFKNKSSIPAKFNPISSIRTPYKAEERKLEKITTPLFDEFFFDSSPIQISKLETNIIVMGASVGGPRTIEMILEKIPQDFISPVLVVQHINHFFMRQFAVRLKDKCKLNVKIGNDGEQIQSGNIYLSHGDKHFQVIEKNGRPSIRMFEGEPVNFCRPSVDVLFYSAARVYKKETVGILLTGMGKDGVEGLKAIKQAGGITIAESKETAILYGMPKMAAESGVADLIVPNYHIPNYMIKFAKKLT